MASGDSDQEKTEDATPARREEFRKKGQVAQSKELASVLTLFGAVLVIWMLSASQFESMREIFDASFGGRMVENVRSDNIIPAATFAFKKAFMIVLPPFAIFFVFGFLSNVLQIGFLQNEEALKFDLQKIDPMQGLKRLFSMKSVVEGVKAVFKVLLVMGVVAMVFKEEITTIPAMMQMSIPMAMAYIGDITLKVLGGVGFLMLVISGMDYAFQRYQLEQQMRMSKQEIKEEYKTREGDPLVKSRIRRIQREMAQKRMMADVPKADVIITNPTHIAIALKYDGSTPAPQLIAKGANKVAERIKEIAREHNIPVVENKPLARTIFKTLEIGNVIPRELYQAVAEVLSYVFRLKKRVVN
jgi:flagellar biosynthetic protein FlhB